MTIISLLLLASLLPHLTFTAHVNVGIVNGTEAKAHSRPYMVSIQLNKTHICGGFLISDAFVLTAAHCRERLQTLTVVVGAHNLENSKNLHRIGVKSYIPHPSYDNHFSWNDIMLLKLQEKVNLSNNAQWILLPGKDDVVKENTLCSVAGWGSLETNGSNSSCLMEANVHIMNNKECHKKWGNLFSQQMMCTHGHGGSCTGDSGGPLVCGNTAVGVTAFGSKLLCNSPENPNVVENLTVVVGAHDYTHGSRRMDVKFYHIHPGYDSKHLLNDIMLIQLHEKVNKSNNIKWISIPKKDKDIKAKTKVKCSVAGWGKKNTKGGASAKLMEVNVTIIDPKECKKYWGKDYSTSRMVCAGGHGGFCQCSTSTMTHFTAILLATAVTTLHFTVVVGDDIINGKKASKNSLQYMVSVQYNKKHHCGGFLISPQYVLTAAHCASEKMTVVLGDHNISAQKNLKRYDVVDKFIPKTFKNVTMGNDIMLLKISRKAVLGGKVKTVTFPHQHYSIKNNTQCLVAGWGSTKERKTVNDLLTSNVSTVDIHDCKEAWKKYKENITRLPPNIICAGGYKQNGGVCLGDSGGPLVCNSMAVGIVSFSIKGCKYPDVPNIFTDISKHARWIKAMMKKKET
ncbi:hypothetical protein Q8A67_005958 [Cirrhinus molitorella]|uniref:trypsin n=1 Tax=Cirrhinus molitorella TaxID=172907 RepID=A0AA88PX02_9TELE|nr:hypothetical protein Q8A67_005958 [Cirrhinus molitorella]